MLYKNKPYDISPETINQKLQTLLDEKTFGENFQFRANQRSAIVKIVFLGLNNLCKSVIVDAPTGTGKSIIAIVAARLFREWKKTGYIITSNLDLQDQYMVDVNNFNLMWGSVKGVDNYNCEINHLTFSLGECKSRGYSKEQIEKLNCYPTCSYFMNRLKAQHAAVSILNYNFWLIQRNYVSKMVENAGSVTSASSYMDEPFEKRDFCFFDESHKIDDIVQSHFSLTLSDKVLDKMLEHIDYMQRENLTYDTNALDGAALGLAFATLMDDDDYIKNLNALRRFKAALAELIVSRVKIQETIHRKYAFGNTVPLELRTALKRCELFKDVSCKLSDYLDIVAVDAETFVKTIDSEGKNVATFNLLKDQLLLKDKLHDESNFSVFMSATFGNAQTWADLTGTEDYEVIEIPNQWNLKKSSPIYLSKNLPKLNYANRDQGIEVIIGELDNILDKHKNEKGIIHTGNFFFNDYILNNSSKKKRFFSYLNSRERSSAIEDFKKSKNGVLIGPSLMEGLDLRDDLSRFQIFLKTPYRVITDNYIKKRMEFDKNWYSWKTGLALIQALGRSIRNENDWAVSYLMDGSFRDFLRHNSNMLPKHILERINYY